MPKKHELSQESGQDNARQAKSEEPTISHRVTELRNSEMRRYGRVRRIFSKSKDYNSKSSETRQFFQTAQNKLLWSVTGNTASEILKERSDPELPTMGLTFWRSKKVSKADVSTAKNYLDRKEISSLRRKVSDFLTYARAKLKKHSETSMKYWDKKLNKFLKIEDPKTFANEGSVSQKGAVEIVHQYYTTFKKRRAETKQSEAAVDDLTTTVDSKLGRNGHTL